MLDAGLVIEARALREFGRGMAVEPANAVGYREAFAFIDGTLDESAMRAQIIRRTWRLTRRQRTWARSLSRCTKIRWALGETAAQVADRVA